jgi:hypothetical protein
MLIYQKSGLAPLIWMARVGVAHSLDMDLSTRIDRCRALDRFRLSWADRARTLGIGSKNRKPVLVFLYRLSTATASD